MFKWGKKPGYIQDRRNADRLKNERHKNEQYLVIMDRIADALERTKTQEQADDDKRSRHEVITIWLLVFTVIFTGAADFIFYATLRDSHENAREQMDRLDQQLRKMEDSSRQTDTQIAVNKDLAQAAKDQAAAARDSITAAHDNIITDSRAWVGPNGATIQSAVTAGQETSFMISYQNTGREPATSFTTFIEPFFVENDNASKPFPAIAASVANCRNRIPVYGTQVVYPTTGFGQTQQTFTFDKDKVDDSVVKGNTIIGVTGCFVYVTFGQVHHSAFCFFYKAGITKIPNLSACANGAYAD